MAFNLDHEDNADAKAALLKRLAVLGPEQVRSMLAVDAFPMGSHVIVLDWLRDQGKARAPKT